MRTLLALGLFALASPAVALEPKDVWLVVNANVPESRQVADHYIAARGVPKENVVVLDLPKGEDVFPRRLRRQAPRPRSAPRSRTAKTT